MRKFKWHFSFKMITEKNKQVIDFEKTAPTHIQELCETIEGGK